MEVVMVTIFSLASLLPSKKVTSTMFLSPILVTTLRCFSPMLMRARKSIFCGRESCTIVAKLSGGVGVLGNPAVSNTGESFVFVKSMTSFTGDPMYSGLSGERVIRDILHMVPFLNLFTWAWKFLSAVSLLPMHLTTPIQ